MIEQILKITSITNLGTHVKNVLDIYLHPIATYKKVLSKRKTSYNFLILHLIYYSLFLYSISLNIKSVLIVILVDVLFTVFPFAMNLVSFTLMRKGLRQKTRWNRLFRILLLIKIQFIPIILILYFVANFLESETAYQIFDNFIWLMWIAFLIIVPLLLNNSLPKMIGLILGNYICFLLIIIPLSFLLQRIDTKSNLTKRFQDISPSLDILSFHLQSNYSYHRISDTIYFTYAQFSEDSSLLVKKTQYASPEIQIRVLEHESDQAYELAYLTYKLNHYKDAIKKNLSVKDFPLRQQQYHRLTLNEADSLRTAFTKAFDEDYNLVKSFYSNSKFETPKKYYSSILSYMDVLRKAYVDPEWQKELLGDCEIEKVIELNETIFLIKVKISNNTYEPYRTNYIKEEGQIEAFIKKSNLISNVLFFPMNFIE